MSRCSDERREGGAELRKAVLQRLQEMQYALLAGWNHLVSVPLMGTSDTAEQTAPLI